MESTPLQLIISSVMKSVTTPPKKYAEQVLLTSPQKRPTPYSNIRMKNKQLVLRAQKSSPYSFRMWSMGPQQTDEDTKNPNL